MLNRIAEFKAAINDAFQNGVDPAGILSAMQSYLNSSEIQAYAETNPSFKNAAESLSAVQSDNSNVGSVADSLIASIQTILAVEPGRPPVALVATARLKSRIRPAATRLKRVAARIRPRAIKPKR